MWTEDDLMLVFRASHDAPETEADLVDGCLGDLQRAKQIAAEDAGTTLAWEVPRTNISPGGTRCRGIAGNLNVHYDIYFA